MFFQWLYLHYKNKEMIIYFLASVLKLITNINCLKLDFNYFDSQLIINGNKYFSFQQIKSNISVKKYFIYLYSIHFNYNMR